MSEREKRSLERLLKSQGQLGEFVRMSMEDMRERDLFLIREASQRLLLEKSWPAARAAAPTASLEHGVTPRGFTRVDFKDRYGEECSLQASSLATEAAIWLGVDTPKLRVMAPQGAGFSASLEFDDGSSGWATVGVKVDGGSVLQTGRMHLTQDMVKVLLPALQEFVDTGELPSSQTVEILFQSASDALVTLRHGGDCPHCEGVGWTDHDRDAVKCPACGGTGEIDMTDPEMLARLDEFNHYEVPA